jgi:molecular chaperone GrpE
VSDPAAPQPESAPADTASTDGADAAASALDSALREVQDWKERCLRQQAEFENSRKRIRREADESSTRAVARFVRPLLDELDNLDRAIAAARPEAFTEFAQGVSMIRAGLHRVLDGAGIQPVPGEGLFDPAVHEVIAEAESADLPKGHIVQVHRAGFRLKDQLVRSAQVVVAKAPAQPPPA